MKEASTQSVPKKSPLHVGGSINFSLQHEPQEPTRRAFSTVLLFKFVRGASEVQRVAARRLDLNDPPTAVGGIHASRVEGRCA